jgi:hypothetical protein
MAARFPENLQKYEPMLRTYLNKKPDEEICKKVFNHVRNLAKYAKSADELSNIDDLCEFCSKHFVGHERKISSEKLAEEYHKTREEIKNKHKDLNTITQKETDAGFEKGGLSLKHTKKEETKYPKETGYV